ncbi:MAG TPA: AHH domain-containing protein, partial [Candidatus Nanopelagicales bacterium]|nr:AHH domain-containing protein [Candidatus Nanopelagicales bacterium]
FAVLNALTLWGYGTYSLGKSLWDGYKEKGILGALDAVNPVTHIVKGSVATYQAAKRGDYRAAGARGAVTAVATAGLVATVAGAGAAVGAARGGAARGAAAAARSASEHHIMTNKNRVSTARGGPWTPRFDDMAHRAGMSLEDAGNRVRIPGLQGPHPEAYHTEVFDRLSRATDGLSGNAYSAAFRAELDAIRTEAATPGSSLNRLLVP